MWITVSPLHWQYLFFVCLYFLFVRLRISPAMIKLAASNFVGGSRAFLARNLPFWGTLVPQKPKIGQIGARRQVLPMDASPLHWRRARAVSGWDWRLLQYGMYGYTAVPKTGVLVFMCPFERNILAKPILCINNSYFLS